MSDISASLLSWLKLSGLQASYGTFSEIGEADEFISIYEKLFPEIEKFEGTTYFIAHLSSNIPPQIKGNFNGIDCDEFEHCDPDLLENIAKIYLFLMYEKKKDVLISQIEMLDETEKEDIYSLLSENEQKKENLSEYAQIIRNYALEIEQSIEVQQKEKDLDKKIKDLKEIKQNIIHEKTEEARNDYEKQLESIKQIYAINKEIENEIIELQNKYKELELEEQGKPNKIEEERRLLHDKSDLETRLKDFQKSNEDREAFDSKYNEFKEQRVDLERKIESLTTIHQTLKEYSEINNSINEKAAELRKDKTICDLLKELDKAKKERDGLIKTLSEIHHGLKTRANKI